MSVTPDFIGQVYKDTATGNIWRANSLTPGDWTLEVQNMQAQWEPKSAKCGELIGYFTYGDLPSLTSISFLGETTVVGFDLGYLTTLQSIAFDNLISVDPANIQAGYIYIAHSTQLSSISMPNLALVYGGFTIFDCPALTSFSAPSLVNTGPPSSYLRVYNNSGLTTLSFPVLVPPNGRTLTFSGNALNQQSVDHILARCVANPAYVSGTVALNGGTNSTPSAAGLADKAILVGRGVVVNNN